VVSTGLQLSNRLLLGSFAFPGLGLVAVSQNLVTLLVCATQWRSLVRPPSLRPLVALGLCSGVSQLLGLAASGFLALSMFGVLRRTSMLVALAVGLWHGERHSRITQLAVFGMTVGAVLASLSDVSFHAVG
jgi:drug/metabolite transporter (DMT)-like permease